LHNTLTISAYAADNLQELTKHHEWRMICHSCPTGASRCFETLIEKISRKPALSDTN
jgi:hypothetical protein